MHLSGTTLLVAFQVSQFVWKFNSSHSKVLFYIFLGIFYTVFVNIILTNTNTPFCLVPVWMCGYLSSALFPAFYTMYLGILFMQVFIPITGRMGASINPDIIIGVVSSVLCIVTAGYFVSSLVRCWFLCEWLWRSTLKIHNS